MALSLATTIDGLRLFFCESLPLETAVRLTPRMRPSLRMTFELVWFDDLEFRIGRAGGVLLDGQCVVGSIGRLNELTILPAYRGRGLAVEMIVAWAMRNPWHLPQGSVKRSRHGAAAYRQAWPRLEAFYTNLL